MLAENTYNQPGINPSESLQILFFDESLSCISDDQFLDPEVISALTTHLKHLSNQSKFSPVCLPIQHTGSYALCVQIDASKTLTPYAFQATGVAIGKHIQTTDLSALHIVWPAPQHSVVNLDACAYIFKGILSSRYSFQAYKHDSKPSTKLTLNHQTTSPEALQKRFTQVTAVVTGESLCKDLMHEPPNRLTPANFADRIAALTECGLTVDILDEDKLRAENMHALLSVGQGSQQESRLACIRWSGKSQDLKDPICLVGKGVCFDSGGINIKLSSLVEMKYDMGGAACVAGAMKSIALLKLPVNVVGIVALTENMSGSNAYRPSDIISSRSGKSIEVLNTDAEGRLILADALDYACDVYKPKAMIDLATLTGAIIVALGHEYAGLYSNDDTLLTTLKTAATESASRIWHMPLDPAYDKLIDCPIADVQNLSVGAGAGSITAAQFLQRFTRDVPWAHIDIAGTAWVNSSTDICAKGPTGYGVSLLTALIEEYAK